MRHLAGDIILKITGLLLLTAAMLKGYQLITEPVANTGIWSNRYFLIFTVEFEAFMGAYGHYLKEVSHVKLKYIKKMFN